MLRPYGDGGFPIAVSTQNEKASRTKRAEREERTMKDRCKEQKIQRYHPAAKDFAAIAEKWFESAPPTSTRIAARFEGKSCIADAPERFGIS